MRKEQYTAYMKAEARSYVVNIQRKMKAGEWRTAKAYAEMLTETLAEIIRKEEEDEENGTGRDRDIEHASEVSEVREEGIHRAGHAGSTSWLEYRMQRLL